MFVIFSLFFFLKSLLLWLLWLLLLLNARNIYTRHIKNYERRLKTFSFSFFLFFWWSKKNLFQWWCYNMWAINFDKSSLPCLCIANIFEGKNFFLYKVDVYDLLLHFMHTLYYFIDVSLRSINGSIKYARILHKS